MILLLIEPQNHPVRIQRKIPGLLHKVAQVWVVRLGREVSTIGMHAQDQGFSILSKIHAGRLTRTPA